MAALLALGLAAGAARPVVYKEPHFSLVNKTDIVYGQGLTCTGSKCKALDLVLDSYTPDDGGATLRPAYIMMHGGGWKEGGKNDAWIKSGASFFGSRGFSCFGIQYRLEKDNGTFPSDWPKGPTPTVSAQGGAEYGATRDLKAAIRWVRANAKQLGVDETRIALGGGSAGAISSIAAGVGFEDDYKAELKGMDPTLDSTNYDVSSSVRALVSHWGSGLGEQIVQSTDKQNRSRYSAKSPPICEFHGDKDTTVPYADALALESIYDSLGVTYEMNTLKGCGHSAWCYGCPDLQANLCRCKDKAKDTCDVMDTTALPFLVTHLDLDLK